VARGQVKCPFSGQSRAGALLPDFRAVKHFSATDVPLRNLRSAIRFNSTPLELPPEEAHSSAMESWCPEFRAPSETESLTLARLTGIFR
jgi:hypothetical protein